MNIRTNHELRLKTFDFLNEFKDKDYSRQELIEKINKEFGIPKGALYDWYSGRYIPCGRKGSITKNPELFYVIGALLGDGCIYNWKITRNYVILVGDKKFTDKFSKFIGFCTNIKTKSYIDRNKNIWFVRLNNFELYSLFSKVRNDINYLESTVNNAGKKSSLLLIEGFFDAEGCVKIIKEPIRKTPKICLDITNTNYRVLDLIRQLLLNNLGIEARYSIQKQSIGKDGSFRKKAYHLRIYKKEFIRKFFENINTTKLKE